MKEVELEEHEHPEHPEEVHHAIQDVPVLVAHQVHVNVYQLNLQPREHAPLKHNWVCLLVDFFEEAVDLFLEAVIAHLNNGSHLSLR